MAESATESMEIAAPPERVLQILLDFEAYPRWARDLKSVSVEQRDDQGRGTLVTFRAAAMGRSTSYTLRYDHPSDGSGLSWTLARGDIMRRLDGSYLLEPVDGQVDCTKVTYQLSVDLVVPIPGFVKRRAGLRIIHTALQELRAHVEA